MTGWIAAVALAMQLAQGAGAKPPSAPPSAETRAPGRPSLDGQLALLGDVLPRKDAVEIRPQLRVEVTGRSSPWFRYRVAALFEGLVADRDGTVTDGLARVRDGWIELGGERGDLRVGHGQLVWGRLDEVQPSDVINPIDAARFVLDGRSSARLAVPFVRARAITSERLVLEGVLVPVFRRGSFDELDEPTSPFNLVSDVTFPAEVDVRDWPVKHLEPSAAWANVSGGGRLSATIGRVDMAGAVFRGLDSFGLISFEPDQTPAPGPVIVGQLVERYPRFTMVAGDFETVAGEWAIRGEVAAFVRKQFSGVIRPGPVDGRAFDAGVGVDRRTGDYRVFASAIVHREWSPADGRVGGTDVSVVASIERQFNRDRYLARAFAVINPGDASAFVRWLLVWNARDNVALDLSAAAFLGTGDDTLGRFKGRDFLFARVRYHF